MIAHKLLGIISMDDVMRRKAEADEKRINDYYNDMSCSMEEGIEKGMKKGIEKGMKKGVKKGKIEGKIEKAIEVAKNLLKSGVDGKIISFSTGLSVSEIEKLKD